MRSLPFAFLVMSLAALACSLPVAAQSLAAAKTCNAGADAQAAGIETWGETHLTRAGPTPKGIKGATTVSPREAKCLLDNLGEKLLVIHVMHDREGQLPGAHMDAEFGSGSERDDSRLGERLMRLSGGDKERPMLYYCYHSSCHMSYNASLRAVRAGYTNVFWLRDGNSGWKAAKLPMKGDEQGKSGLPVRYEKDLEPCLLEERYTARSYVDLLVVSKSDADLRERFASVLATYKKDKMQCLTRLEARYRGDANIISDIERRKASVDINVDEFLTKARDNVESTPNLILPELEGINLSGARAFLRSMGEFVTLEQSCGRLPTHMPSDNDELQRIRDRISSFDRCAAQLEKDHRNQPRIQVAFFENLVTKVDAIGRYTCMRRSGANCIHDESWRRVASVINDVSLTDVRRAAGIQSRRELELDRAARELATYIEKVTAHIDETNARIDEHNARVESRRSRSSDSGGGTYAPMPSYPSPPAVVPRRGGNSSAPGIR